MVRPKRASVPAGVVELFCIFVCPKWFVQAIADASKKTYTFEEEFEIDLLLAPPIMISGMRTTPFQLAYTFFRFFVHIVDSMTHFSK